MNRREFLKSIVGTVAVQALPLPVVSTVVMSEVALWPKGFDYWVNEPITPILKARQPGLSTFQSTWTWYSRELDS